MTAAPVDQSNKGHRHVDSADDPAAFGRASVLFGLRVRLLILVALILLPAFGVVLYTGHRDRESATRDAERHASALAVEAAGSQTRLIDQARNLLALLANIPAVAQATGSCPSFLKHYLSQEPSLSSIGVIDSTGHLICSSPSSNTPGLDLRSRTYFQRTMHRGHFALGHYRIGQITGEPILVAAYPMLGSNGKVHRVLFTGLRLHWFTAMAARAKLPRGSVFTLFDSTGRLLARYPAAGVHSTAQDHVVRTLQKLAAMGQMRDRSIPVDGNNWLVRQTNLGSNPATRNLKAVIAMPTAVAFAAPDRAMERSVAFLLGLASLSFVLCWTVSDRLVLKPVRLLVRAAQRLRGGDMRARTGIHKGPYELRLLGNTFDTMAGSLQKQLEDAESQSRHIARLNRIYRVLSAVNGAIVRLRDRDQLLEEICRIAVELGNFPFTWVGLVEPESGLVRVAAQAGGAEEYIQSLRVTLDPTDPDGRGLVPEAIRSGAHAVSNDALQDRRLAARWAAFSALGIRSEAAFPLRVLGQIIGAIALHAEEPGFFDEKELTLFDEIAADTSLGLEHIEREQQLNYLAYWDPLTNLPNRTLFEDRLAQSMRRAERDGNGVAVLVLNLLHFGRVNDTKGRAAGDRILQTVAARLSAATRNNEPPGDLGEPAARLGTHEFAVLLDDVSDELAVHKAAERLSRALARPVALQDGDIALRFRMGAAIYPVDSRDPEDLIHKALLAVHHQSKSAEQALTIYSPESDSAARERFALENDLRHAVEAQSFYLEYQPRVDARTSRLTGAEALLRWERPGHGRVPPDQFIPLLEELGLIGQVGEWVARTALSQRVAWADTVADDFVVSINVSSHELRSPDYVSRILCIIEDIGVRPQWVEIEITETGLIETGSHTLELLAALNALGIRLSVDDFGTGYSSLNYLRHFPVKILKIDKSFVHDIAMDGDALSLVQSIVALADALKLTTVAEGVETHEQVSLLAERGCHEIQGYYYSRPLLPEALLEWANGHSNRAS